jgi:hypothetical protein
MMVLLPDRKLCQQPLGVIDVPLVAEVGHGTVLAVVDESVGGDVTVGIVGTDGAAPT